MTAFEVDSYVVDTLMADLVGHDHRPSAFLVYLILWRATRGGTREARLSLREISESTGLSKRGVQSALGTLTRRRLVSVGRDAPTAVPGYTLHRPWARRPRVR